MARWLAALLIGLGLSLPAASCSRQQADIFPVFGKVTCQGQPAAGAVVFFRRHGGSAASDPLIMGIVRENGGFELVCGSLGRGAPQGDYDVAIEWRQPSPHRGGPSRAGPDRLAGRYADPSHPLLRARVVAGPNDLPPFELTVGPSAN
jgi:hypothetical protein